jgi:hypothetical protein
MHPIRGGFMRLFPNFLQASVGRSAMPSQRISMGCTGLSPTDPYKRFWYAQKFGSKSIRGNGGEETHLPWSSNTVIAELDAKLESKLYSMANLMKPLPISSSRTTHISSLKK